MISLLKSKAQQLVNSPYLQKKRRNMQKGSQKIGFKGNWVRGILSKQQLRLHIVSTVEGERRENSLLFDKYTVAQEEYFLIRNSESLQEEYWLR